MKGYVYILSNPSMPGIVKIGRTTRSVHGRAGELYQTGVPTPFVVEHSVLSPDCAALEQSLHSALDEVRVGADREFFRITADVARDTLNAYLHEQVLDFVQEFLPDHTVTETCFFVDPADLYCVCDGLDVSPMELASAIEFLDKSAAQKAVEIQRERFRRIRERAEVSASGGLLN